MPDVHDPHVSILDKIMDAVWISRDETAAKSWGLCITNSEMGSRGDQFSRIENRSTQPVGRSRILSIDIPEFPGDRSERAA
jgi:hypothetical protein